MKEMILVKKLRAEDQVELPMDEAFYDALHAKIMISVDKTEVKKLSKLAKTWVFLERKTQSPRNTLKKLGKVGVRMMVIVFALGAVQLGLNLQTGMMAPAADAKLSSILVEAQKNPMEWSELAASYQNENDFYAEILSQRDLSTMVEIDKALTSSL